MKPTNFAMYLTKFITNYLTFQKNFSQNTIISYKDTFKLLLIYCRDIEHINPEKIVLDHLTKDLIVGFLNWIEVERGCSISTRNQRLAALKSFFKYVQIEEPAGIFNYQKILSITNKKSIKKVIEYITPEAMQLLLSMPDKSNHKGRRHLAIMSLLYDTGARVQELIDITMRDIRLQAPAVITLKGKGNKNRQVPLMSNTVLILRYYISENKLDDNRKIDYPLFTNSQNRKLTKEGVAYIINKYVDQAFRKSNIIPSKVTPHMFRHSKAMHLLEAGVNSIYIRDFLGHTDLKTTEIYAKSNLEMKRKAIEKAFPEIISSDLPDWNKDTSLISWLSNL